MISIIIPYFNGHKYIYKCLNSIKENTINHYEIIIIDDCSSIPINENIKKEYSKTKIIKNKINKGFVQSSNIGASKAKGDLLVFLNMDTEIITYGWDNIIIKNFSKSKSIGIVAAKLLYPNNHVQFAGGIIDVYSKKPIHRYRNTYRHSPLIEKNEFIDWCTGAFLAIPKILFDTVKGFSDDYLAMFEDVDLSFKVRKQKYKILYEPKIEIYHYEGVTGIGKINYSKSYDIFKIKWTSSFLNRTKKNYEKDGFNEQFISRLYKLFFENFAIIQKVIDFFTLNTKIKQKQFINSNTDLEIIEKCLKAFHSNTDIYAKLVFYKFKPFINANLDKDEILNLIDQYLSFNIKNVETDEMIIRHSILTNFKKQFHKKQFYFDSSFCAYKTLYQFFKSKKIYDKNFLKLSVSILFKNILLLKSILPFKELYHYTQFITKNIRNIEFPKKIIILYIKLLTFQKNNHSRSIYIKTLKLIESYDYNNIEKNTFYINIASFLKTILKYSDAINILENKCNIKENNKKLLTSYYFHLGDAYLHLKDFNKAKKCLKKCLIYTRTHKSAKSLLKIIK